MTETSLRKRPGAPRRGDTSRDANATWLWLAQAATGTLLLVLLVVHMVANHFVAPDGLRTYAEVVDYLRHPLVATVEILFLVTVTWHALLGVRAVLLDLGPSRRATRRIGQALTVLGVITVAYGLGLLALIASRG